MLLCDVTFNKTTNTAEFIAWRPIVSGAKKALTKVSRMHPMGGIYRDTASGIEAMRRWNKKALAEGAGPLKRFRGSLVAMRRPLGMAPTLGSPFGSAAGEVLYKGAKAAGKAKGGILEKTKAGLRGAGTAFKRELTPTGTIATGLGAPVGKIHMVQKAGKAITKRAKQAATKGKGAAREIGRVLTTPVSQLWQQRKAVKALDRAKPRLAPVFRKRLRYAAFKKKLLKGKESNWESPKKNGRFKGVSVGQDKKGFYVYTHRARSKSYPAKNKIPNSVVKKIESTG